MGGDEEWEEMRSCSGGVEEKGQVGRMASSPSHLMVLINCCTENTCREERAEV